jgi:TonB family protein
MPAQDKLPKSLARLGLPDDPKDVPHLVSTRDLPIFHVFEVGCPSDGGWAAAAFAALEEAAETDWKIRLLLGRTLGTRVLSRDLCLSDLPGFEAWLADQLRQQWSDGVLPDEDGVMSDEDSDSTNWPFYLLGYTSLSKDSATRALVRDIAMDSTVTDYWRDQAARTMITQRYGEDLVGKDLRNDQRYWDAVRSVLSDLASGPPLPEFQRYMEEWFSTVQAEREREEVLRVARREGWARPEIPDTCRSSFVPARRVSSSGLVSDMITRYYPDELRGAGIGGKTALTLQIDERGNVKKARVRESSGNRHFDEAALRVAWLLRYSPALACDKPVRDVARYSLRFYPGRRQEQGSDRAAKTGRTTWQPMDKVPPAFGRTAG